MARSPTFLLPVDAYVDEAWHERERRQLFARSWSLVASTAELTSPGDWLTVEVAGVPIVIVLDDAGQHRAFHNMCRHRGMVMLDGRGAECRSIRCPYHDWRFGLDGALQVVPQRREQFCGIETSELGLIEAGVHAWEGMIFVCPDPDAPPFTDHAAGFTGAIGSYRPSLLPEVARRDLPVRCNWKLLVENHIDVYHLWYLHLRSLAGFDHRRFEHRSIGPHWVSYEPSRAAKPALGATGREIRHIDDRDRAGIGAHLLFPNVLFASTAEFFMSYAVVPTSATTSRMELRIRAEPDADPAPLLASAESFIREDIEACERIQQALRSPWFSVGPLAATHEAPIEVFHSHVLERLG